MTREEAIKALNEYGTLFPSDKSEAIDMAIEALQTDIVRCGECKSSYTVDFTNTPARVIKRFCRIRRNALTGSFTVQDNDFCSYGERRPR